MTFQDIKIRLIKDVVSGDVSPDQAMLIIELLNEGSLLVIKNDGDETHASMGTTITWETFDKIHEKYKIDFWVIQINEDGITMDNGMRYPDKQSGGRIIE